MTCNEIENRLPAYREEILSPEEKKIIAGHLASCSRCRRSFADLNNTEKIVQSLGEVEPPPFFEQRIMSRVREEGRQKQGILRRFFYPLHIKIPIQVFATLVVAVLAFHVYRQGEPVTQQLVPPPLPLSEPGKDQIRANSPQGSAFSSDSPPAVPAPARDNPENGQGFAAPPTEKAGQEQGKTLAWAPGTEERPAADKTADAVLAGREKETPPVSAEAAGKAKDRAEKLDAGKALALSPEQQRKEKMTDTIAAVEESRKRLSSPSPSGAAVKAEIKLPVIDLTIQANGREAAFREIEARLNQVKARIIEKKRRQGSEFLQAEIAAHDVAALLDLLGEVGKVTREANYPDAPDGNVTVTIKIVGHW